MFKWTKGILIFYHVKHYEKRLLVFVMNVSINVLNHIIKVTCVAVSGNET